MSARAGTGLVVARAMIGMAIIVGISLPVSFAQVRDHDPRWAAPPEARAKVNPLLDRPEAVAGGGKLFRQRCATCHGDDGRGTVKAPDLTTRDVQAQTDGELYWKISTGHTHAGMPAFSFLPEQQRWQLVLHLREAPSNQHRGAESSSVRTSGRRRPDEGMAADGAAASRRYGKSLAMASLVAIKLSGRPRTSRQHVRREIDM